MGVDVFDFRVGCGAHGCIMRIDPTGPGTGTCRCLPREMLPDDRVRLRRQIAALRDRLAEVELERDALRAIIAGRTTPPTDAEIEAHDGATGGFWMVFCEDDFDLDMITDGESRDAWVKAGAIGWVPYSDGRPCAWPAAKESE